MIKLNNDLFTEASAAKRKPKFILALLIFLLVYLIVSEVMSLVITVPTIVWTVNNEEIRQAAKELDLKKVLDLINRMPDWLMALNLFATVGEIAVPILFCKIIEKRKISSMGFVRRRAFVEYLKGYLIGFVMITAALLLCVVTGQSRITYTGITASALIYVVIFFVGYLIQGAAEETLCRGYLMISLNNSINRVRKKNGSTLLAAAISSAVFSLMHLANPGVTFLSLVNIFLAGMGFAVYVIRTGNIWGACAMHSAWNFFQGNFWGINVSGLVTSASVFHTVGTSERTLLNGGGFGLEGGLAVTVIELVFIAIFLFVPYLKKKDEPQTVENDK